MNDWYIAVDIGGTQLRAARFPADGIEPVVQHSAPTKADDGSTSLQRLLDLLAGIWPQNGTVKKVGVAVAGPVNPQTGVVYRSPNIPGWECLPLAGHIHDRFHVPVELGNDANLAALGEWKYGAGIGHHDLLYLTISTGIGGGVILDDRLLVGGRGIAAEVGHITVLPDGPLCGCGQRGHLEAVASGTAIARYVTEHLARGRESSLGQPVEPISARTVAAAAAAGDALAQEAFDQAALFLGRAIADFLHLYDPTIIVLGGGVVKSGDLLLKPLRKALEASVMSPQYLEGLELTTAQLGEQVGLIGALVLARA